MTQRAMSSFRKKKTCSVLQKMAEAVQPPLNECDGQHRHWQTTTGVITDWGFRDVRKHVIGKEKKGVRAQGHGPILFSEACRLADLLDKDSPVKEAPDG